MSGASEKIILLADCQSFYASVEKTTHPQYENQPVVVAGDPSRRSGIILAACPIAKQYGVTTAERLGESLRKCPQLVVIKPRMQTYIDISLLITRTLEDFSELVEPYSIDEQFVDISQSLGIFGSPDYIAQQIQQKVYLQTNVRARIGISSTKVLAKMACDIFAKKNESGIYTLLPENMPETLWTYPIKHMFGVGSRMAAHFKRMGMHTIGDLAQTPLKDLKRLLRMRLGKNSDIAAEVFWRTANGLDDSPVTPSTHDKQQAVSHGMTLPRDYTSAEDIQVVLLELAEEVCRRCRFKGYMGRVVSVGVHGADYEHPTGFHRQITLADPSHITREVYQAANRLFVTHWDGMPVRKVSLALSGISENQDYQLTLFEDREKISSLENTTDEIKRKYGYTAILRASSMLQAGQAKERSAKIGGHYK